MIFFKNLFQSLARKGTGKVTKVDTWLSRASILHLDGDNASALLICNDALQIDPGNHMAYYLRSLVKNDLEDKEGALVDQERSLFLIELLT